MPAKLNLTPEEALERLERRREQTRLAVQRYRARQKDTVSHTVSHTQEQVSLTPTPENGVVRLTPPPRTRLPVTPQRTPTPPKGGPPPPTALAVPKPNKSGELIDLLRAAGVKHLLQAKDHAALKGTPLSAAEVAEVYIAIARGEFGDDWMCDRLNVADAIKAWPGYQNRKARGPRPAPGRPVPIGTQILRSLGHVGE